MIEINLEGYESSYVEPLSRCIADLTELDGAINAAVKDQEEVKDLNKRYAGKDESTDVLSFSYIEDKLESETPSTLNPQLSTMELGDMVVSRQHLARQAEKAGTSEETELVLLLLHGALHILGYDHAGADGRQQMEALQADTMSELGLTYRDFDWQDA